MSTLHIGLDPSINSTGFSVFLNGKILIDYGVIKPKSSGATTDAERLIVLRSYVTNLIHKHCNEHKVNFADVTVVIEDFQIRKEDYSVRNFDNLKKLIYAIGSCVSGCIYGCNVEMVKPLQWKGMKSKKKTVFDVERMYKLKNVNHNACDAIMMVHAFISIERINKRIGINDHKT